MTNRISEQVSSWRAATVLALVAVSSCRADVSPRQRLQGVISSTHARRPLPATGGRYNDASRILSDGRFLYWVSDAELLRYDTVRKDVAALASGVQLSSPRAFTLDSRHLYVSACDAHATAVYRFDKATGASARILTAGCAGALVATDRHLFAAVEQPYGAELYSIDVHSFDDVLRRVVFVPLVGRPVDGAFKNGRVYVAVAAKNGRPGGVMTWDGEKLAWYELPHGVASLAVGGATAYVRYEYDRTTISRRVASVAAWRSGAVRVALAAPLPFDSGDMAILEGAGVFVGRGVSGMVVFLDERGGKTIVDDDIPGVFGVSISGSCLYAGSVYTKRIYEYCWH